MNSQTASESRPGLIQSPAYPWIAWGAAALFFFYGFLQRVAPSVMTADLMREFDITAAALGNLTAFYFYAYAAMQLPAGAMLDRWGPRRILTIASAICTSGALLFAYADSEGMAYAGRFLIGAGSGVAMLSTLKVASIWFPIERYATLFGLTALLGVAGAVGGQAPLAAVVELSGWRDTMLGVAIFAALLTPVLWFVVRDGAGGGRGGGHVGTMVHGLGAVMNVRQTWLIAITNATAVAPLLAFAGLWGVPFLMEAYGLERPAAAASTSLLLAGHGVGAPLLGWISDRVRRRKPPILIGSSLTLASFSMLVGVPGLPFPLALACLTLCGMASGISSCCYAAAREHNRTGLVGTTAGCVNMITMTTSAVFQPVIGWLLDLAWSGGIEDGVRVYAVNEFRVAFISIILGGVVGLLAASRIRETECRSVGAKM